MIHKNVIMVDIIMTTYNHEKYIASAIESVLKQITEHNYRLIISNDCSQDNTSSICRDYVKRYPEKIVYLEHEKNLGLLGNYQKCLAFSDAKYIAILEGDDMWATPHKLQSQVDILETNQNIGLVHSNYSLYYEEASIFITPRRLLEKYCNRRQGLVFNDLLKHNFICPLTTMFRSSLIKDLDFDYMRAMEYKTIDYHMWLDISLKSEICYMKDCFGVYRISNKSVSNTNNFQDKCIFDKTRLNIIKYFKSKSDIKDLACIAENEINTKHLLRAIRSYDFNYIAKYHKDFDIGSCIRLIKYYLLYKY